MTTEMQQLKVAFASTDGITVNGHFGSCEHFYIYTIRIKSLLRQLVKYGAVKNFETSIVDRSGKVIPCI